MTEPGPPDPATGYDVPTTRDETATDYDESRPVRVVGRLFLLASLPFLGVILFGLGGGLGLRAFAHNNSLDCSGPAGFGSTGPCTHYSYVLPVALGVVGMLIAMAGGIAASYYAARHIGVPVFQALRARHYSSGGNSGVRPSR